MSKSVAAAAKPGAPKPSGPTTAAQAAPRRRDDPLSGGVEVAKLVRVVVILSAATLLSLVAAVIGLKAGIGSKVVAIAVDAKGVITPAVVMSEPLVAESRVVGYVEECVRRAFSHDFLHFGQTIPLAQDCFTPEASEKYVKAMQPYIKLMEEKRMVMGLTVPNPPRVIEAYLLSMPEGKVAHWKVQLQVEIFFEGRSERIPPQRNTIDVVVRRVPLESTPRGILIDQFTVGPA